MRKLLIPLFVALFVIPAILFANSANAAVSGYEGHESKKGVTCYERKSKDRSYFYTNTVNMHGILVRDDRWQVTAMVRYAFCYGGHGNSWFDNRTVRASYAFDGDMDGIPEGPSRQRRDFGGCGRFEGIRMHFLLEDYHDDVFRGWGAGTHQVTTSINVPCRSDRPRNGNFKRLFGEQVLHPKRPVGIAAYGARWRARGTIRISFADDKDKYHQGRYNSHLFI